MRNGLQLILKEAFQTLNLHRLEANIQPDNLASIRLVSTASFVNLVSIFGWVEKNGKITSDGRF
ncbi:L-amino acid N-acyltransferase YncA [Prolinoborus sp. 3657]|nr:L-amino acid N-acyltransferase YncA [Prolinoborus sp. 3657]